MYASCGASHPDTRVSGWLCVAALRTRVWSRLSARSALQSVLRFEVSTGDQRPLRLRLSSRAQKRKRRNRSYAVPRKHQVFINIELLLCYDWCANVHSSFFLFNLFIIFIISGCVGVNFTPCCNFFNTFFAFLSNS